MHYEYCSEYCEMPKPVLQEKDNPYINELLCHARWFVAVLLTQNQVGIP